MHKISAQTKNIRHSPDKIRAVARNITTGSALINRKTLSLSPKKAAKILLQVIDSAIANARSNFNLPIDTLTIKELQINAAKRVRRPKYRARRRMDITQSRYSHVKVVLESSHSAPEEKT